MGLRINTNISSLGAQRRLGETSRALGRSYARLASGRRIATAADDAAGLGISERMRAEVRSIGVARRNLLDGVSFIQVAEGALMEVGEILHRTRELALQGSNGTLTDGDRRVLDSERAELASEAQRIIENAQFNGIEIFGGSSGIFNEQIQLQVGPESGDVLVIQTPNASRVGVALPSLSVATMGQARRSLRVIDIAIDLISEARGGFGATQLRLESAGRSLAAREENTSAAMSRIADVDVAHEAANRTRLEILQAATVSVLAQANVQPNLALQLLSAPFAPLGGALGTPPTEGQRGIQPVNGTSLHGAS